MKKLIVLLIIFAYHLSYSQWEAVPPLPAKLLYGSLATIGDNVYAGSTTAGVYLSQDKGVNWTPKNIGDTKPRRVKDIALSGNNIFVATSDSGVYRSNDMGDTWINLLDGLVSLEVNAIAASENNIFAGTNAAGIFYSSDNGDTWVERNNGISNLEITKIAIDGENIFVGTNGGGMFYSNNMGNDWTPINEGLSESEIIQVRSLDLNGNNVAISTEEGIFTSKDLGLTWSQKYIYPAILKFYNDKLYRIPDFPSELWVSNDMGDTWELINKYGLSYTYSEDGKGSAFSKGAVSFAFVDDNIIVGTRNNSINVSTDNGNTFHAKSFWEDAVTSILVTSSHIFVTSKTLGATLNLIGGIYKSTNMGNIWNSGLGNVSIQSTVSKGDTIFAVGDRKGIFYSTDFGESWNEKELININENVYGLYPLAINGDIWAIPTSTLGVLVSTDAGNSWNNNQNGPKGARCVAIDGNNIFVGTAGVTGLGFYLSTDYGDTWQSKGLDSLQVYQIEISGNDIFVGTQKGLYHSTDYGETWVQKFYDISLPFVTNFLYYEGNLFISATGAGYAVNSFYVSKDKGDTWVRKDQTLPNSHTTFFDMGGRTTNIVAKDGYIYTVAITRSCVFRAKISDMLSTVSVNDDIIIHNNGIKLYPNPAGDFINIAIDNDADLLAREVQILDLLGLVVSKQELTDGNNRIDISNLPRGTYFIKVGDRVEKFVKM